MIKITMGIALYGGSFDPLHKGHLSFASEAIKLDGVTDIYFIPANVSPFKDGRGQTTSPESRLEMVSSAVGQFEHFKVLDLEIRRGGKSYTIDTVKEMIEFFPEEEILLMIGEDTFKDIEKWHKADELLKMVDLIVMVRPESDVLQSMDSSSSFCYDRNSNVITSSYGRDVHLITENLSSVSSTNIRDKVKTGQSIKDLVPPEIDSYIKANKIYK